MSDAGLFNLDFRDERYLPFEYAGAVSSWKLELPDPNKVPQFDYRTISDVVVHIDYTAREGGEDLRTAALDAADTALRTATPNGVGYQLLMVQDAFPNEWKAFLNPGQGETVHKLTLPMTAGHFPHFAQRRGFTIDTIDAYLIPTRSVSPSDATMAASFIDDALADPAPAPTSGTFTEMGPEYEPVLLASFTSLTATAQPWRLEIDTALNNVPDGLDPDSDDFLDPDAVAGMLLVIHYKLDA